MPADAAVQSPDAHLGGAEDSSLPVVLRATPPGVDWVFYSREEPRMHLQTGRSIDPPYKVWLESHGRFSLEKCGEVPAKLFGALQETFASKPELGWRVRAEWVRRMILNGWLSHQLEGDIVRLVAYPGTRDRFERRIRLAQHAPAAWFARPEELRLDPEFAALIIGATRPETEWVLIDLADVPWDHSQ